MLPTFVIGLREGLEATLIISIIATFLRRNGASLRGMWIGIAAAVTLSIAVGVGLQVVDQSLPQREQEGMETVIGAVAVFFVTSMILWMRTHARHLKRDLEAAAESALGTGTASAMTAMVFLAVLREGFETSVFLLGTFQASTDPGLSATGAVLGIAAAIVIGYGIYRGGVRLNLARFFKVTGVFLVFVAAGLVLSALRTAHEAGWVTFGQGTTVDLSWLAPNGAIRTALISGVLGIPRDPRQVELLGWACYLLPVLAVTVWPNGRRLSTAAASRARLAGAGALVVAAAVLALVVPLPAGAVSASAPLEDGGQATVAVDGQTGALTVTPSGGAAERWTLSDPTSATTSGADTSWTLTAPQAGRPATLDLATLLTYTGSRVPVGLDVNRTPGPYDAAWTERATGTVLTRDGGLVDAQATTKLVLTLTGGGLSSPRVLSIDPDVVTGGAAATGTTVATGFTVDPGAVSRTSAAITAAGQQRGDRVLWKRWFPGLLVVAAAGLVLADVRRRRRPGAGSPAPSSVAAPVAAGPRPAPRSAAPLTR